MEASEPNTADRIKEARIKIGLTAKYVADKMKLNIEAYDDLESYSDEAFMCVSLKQLKILSKLLSVRLIDLVVNEPQKINETRITVEILVERIKNSIIENSETVGEFNERAGWDITSALNNAENIWTDWNLDQLREVSSMVDVNWKNVLIS
ncbi:MAG: transcriptional regulator with XRE-family HTH domain [Gammaproteobacteria bacterium]|jgi:transcriptional regulator with XRE-family HTH domain